MVVDSVKSLFSIWLIETVIVTVEDKLLPVLLCSDSDCVSDSYSKTIGKLIAILNHILNAKCICVNLKR